MKSAIINKHLSPNTIVMQINSNNFIFIFRNTTIFISGNFFHQLFLLGIV